MLYAIIRLGYTYKSISVDSEYLCTQHPKVFIDHTCVFDILFADCIIKLLMKRRLSLKRVLHVQRKFQNLSMTPLMDRIS